MYFPWCGLINQIILCDIYVNYDDVQLSRGFYNRVQVKRPNGVKFITVPIKNKRQKLLIRDAEISYEVQWINNHRTVLEESFKHCAYKSDALDIFDKVHEKKFKYLSDLSFESILAILKYLGLYEGRKYINSSVLKLDGKGGRRLLDITKNIGGRIYITGHGAFNYLDHTLFEENGIEVRYMNYGIAHYEQSHGSFTPFVTSLDAIAHLGPNAARLFKSSTINWQSIKNKDDLIRVII